MRFLFRMREGFSRFMIGRYGTDSLNQFLTVCWLVLAALNLVFHSLVLYLLELFLCFAIFFRMFSKNIVKRRKEANDWYRFCTQCRYAVNRFRNRKTTRFFRCPHCSAPLRMPRKIGKFRIRCRKCGKEFVKEFKR